MKEILYIKDKCNFPTCRHVQEHIDIPDVDVNSMSPEELSFYYFKMIDVDKNAKLDGIELVASIIHYSSM